MNRSQRVIFQRNSELAIAPSTQSVKTGSEKTRFVPMGDFVPTVLTPGLVRPLSVCAAGRKSFEVMICCELKPTHAKSLIFTRLPLAEMGWEFLTAEIELARRSLDGFPIWKMTRG
jgi:hypothetical protein